MGTLMTQITQIKTDVKAIGGMYLFTFLWAVL